MAPAAKDPDRPLRADAQRNRAKLLAAAETVFAERGPSASTEEIARAAGVGVGTVFRHYRSKEALLEAVLVSRLQRLADDARRLSDAEDPGAALFGFFTRVVEESAQKNAFADALAEAGVDVKGTTEPMGRDLRRAIGVLLRRAQQSGAVRPDVGVAEVLALLVGTSRATEQAGSNTKVRTRIIAVVIDGLRP